jgi:thiol:disulfide interchange protein
MAAKPVVDGIEQQHQGALRVIRLDVQDDAAAEIAERYGMAFTPTFIYFDARGSEQWRSVGSIDPQRVANALHESA